MKVFLAGTSFEPAYGGPAVSVSRLAAGLAARGVEVVLWAPDGSAASSPLLNDTPGFDRRSGRLAPVLKEMAASLDIIHDNGIWLRHNHAIARAAKRLGVPRVVTLRGMLEPWAFSYRRAKKKVAWTMYQRRDLDLAAVLHATAVAEAENARRHGLKPPIVVVPNGIDIPATRPELNLADGNSDSRRRAVFVGRIHPIKGLPMLLDAWARTKADRWELVIAGPAENRHDAELRQQAKRLGIEANVTISGPVYGAEKTILYHSADLAVLPSHSESFGVSVAEALAHELPVMATMAAPWSLLRSERCGWWVPATPMGVAEGLASATATPACELRAMGRRGRSAMSDRFTWARVAEAVHEEIYIPFASSARVEP